MLAAATVVSDAKGAAIDLTRSSGGPGTALIIHGTGFPPGEVVALYIDHPNPYLYLNPPPGPIAATDGTVTDSLKWPGKNYDSSHQIDPTLAGTHLVCGDTGYPDSHQAVSVKACAPFDVLGPSPSPGQTGTGSGLPLPLVAVVVVAVIGLAVGGQWLMTRGSQTEKRGSKTR
jgi:hypothetical protein